MKMHGKRLDPNAPPRDGIVKIVAYMLGAQINATKIIAVEQRTRQKAASALLTKQHLN